jgi:hypothetical protein
MIFLPYGWPQPITSRKFCNDFNTPIAYHFLALCCQTSRTHWIDNRARSKVTSHSTIPRDSAGTRAGTGEIQSISVQKLTDCDVCIIERHSWHDMQPARGKIGIPWIISSPVERASSVEQNQREKTNSSESLPESPNLNFVRPIIKITEIVVHDEAVLQ